MTTARMARSPLIQRESNFFARFSSFCKMTMSFRPKSGEWIEELFQFKQFLYGVLNSKEKPSVKVALLDDGAKLTDLSGKQDGSSFRPDKEGYFVGPSTHGTEMARCIRTICPMAELYIARLDDSQKVENQKFTTASACKVRLFSKNRPPNPPES